jgi:hypothetical protein
MPPVKRRWRLSPGLSRRVAFLIRVVDGYKVKNETVLQALLDISSIYYSAQISLSSDEHFVLSLT